MKQISRLVLKVLAAAGILVTVGLILIIILILVTNFSDSQLQAQQLAAFDQQFSMNRNLILSEATGDLLLPEQVGNFNRSNVRHYTEGCYEWHFRGIVSCFETVYSIVNENSRQATVWVSIWGNSVRGIQKLGDLVGSQPCGAELEGEIILRTESKFPYVYRICPAFLIGTPSLNGIIWQNGDWFIAITGQYEALRQFIADYPY